MNGIERVAALVAQALAEKASDEDIEVVVMVCGPQEYLRKRVGSVRIGPNAQPSKDET